MNRLRTIFGIAILAFGFSSVQAQLDEISLSAGGATYFGDLTPTTSIFSTGKESYSVSAGVSYSLSDYLSVRGQLSLAKFSGDDQFQQDENRRMRNLSFRNQLIEGAVMIDFNITDAFSRTYQDLQIHALLGLAVYKHNPQALLGGTWYDLQPLGTEGQIPRDSLSLVRGPYNLVQMAVPLGFYVEYEINRNFSIGIEYLHRITFTDFIDDVSTRYPDLDALEARNGSIARQLAFRTVELDGMQDATPLGIRGNSEETDAYATLQLRLIYKWSGSKVRYYNRRNR